MHRTVIAIAAASIALAGPALAQSSYAPAGAQFEARFDRALSSKRLHDGDRFTLIVDVPSQYAVPPALKRARIEGHAEHVSPARKDHRATLNLIFDDVVLADGTMAPIEATIVALGMRDPHTGRLRDGGVRIRGEVAGTRPAPRGAMVGTGAGTALEVRDAQAQIELKRGTIVLVKLLEPITTVG